MARDAGWPVTAVVRTRKAQLRQAVRVRRRRAIPIAERAAVALGALLLLSVTMIDSTGMAPSPFGEHPGQLSRLAALLSPAPARTSDAPMSTPERSVRQGGDLADSDGMAVRRAAAPDASRAARPTGWYRLAAAEYGISAQLLEALHQVESNAAPDSCVRNLQGSGATGPFQFKPATFAQFGVDANHDGVADICGFSDSVFSAARYLGALGADHDPASTVSRRALRRYGTDVDRVVGLALAYQQRDSLVALAPASIRE